MGGRICCSVTGPGAVVSEGLKRVVILSFMASRAISFWVHLCIKIACLFLFSAPSCIFRNLGV